MIDINELRMVLARHGTSVLNEDEVLELLDRLEAAESDALEQARLNGMGASREATLMAKLEAAEKERDWHADRCEDAMSECASLRARVEAMEKQEPVARFNWSKGELEWLRPWNYNTMNMKPLYLAPGAQPAQKAGLVDDMNLLRDNNTALRARIEVMEKQEPVGLFARIDGDGPLMECKHADISRVPLYLAPGAQPAPSVPDAYWKQAVEEISDEGFGAVFKRLISDQAAMLATTPEAKP